MAKMGKLTPEEEARNKMLMRERDRERKRMKRMNPEYRRMEQERDRDRKKARRSNEAFRQLEKLRDKIRKDRKKGIIVNEALPSEFVVIPPVPVEPEIIISDPLPPDNTQVNNRNRGNVGNSASTSVSTNNSSTRLTTISNVGDSGNTNNNGNNSNNSNNSSSTTTHMSQVNKGLIYPPPNFSHHPLPIPGVTLMPQLCHPILHQNLSATLYPPNGIKQEYGVNDSTSATASTSSSSPGHLHGSNNSSGGVNCEESEVTLIEPEIILQTSSEIIAAPHHFHNHAHTHHLHQQQCSMFPHMTSPAHMPPHLRGPHVSSLPPPPPPTSSNLASHAQQQQQMQHYAPNKNS